MSSCVMDASGLLTGDAAARLPRCSDQLRASRRAVSLSEFMAPAFAEVRRDQCFLSCNGFRLLAQGQASMELASVAFNPYS
jgi:hypothetical protein